MAKAMTCDEFIRRAQSVHGDMYDYSDTEYVNMRVKVAVRCRVHGVFRQLPQAHLMGQGCPVCGAQKQKQTLLDRYGVDNPMKLRSVYEKARETSKARYGHEWAVSSNAVQSKIANTNQLKYGCVRPCGSPVVREKMLNTMRLRYGVDNPGQVSEFREKARRTCEAKFGMKEPLAADEVREKIIKTNLQRYGCESAAAALSVRKKIMDTVMERYGVPYVTNAQVVTDKMRRSKIENNTFHTSHSEDVLYERLCEVFGKDDVLRQYSSDLYPFVCDFYIVSRDLRIELNGSWTHGTHWFSETDIRDTELVRAWSEKQTKYYDNAIHVWTNADVCKRVMAEKNALNYVVFWDTALRDADLWFAMGCPDGTDWQREYSWLPSFDDLRKFSPSKLTGTFSNLSMVAKRYQFSAFYARELAMWRENKMFRGLPLRVWLYANRLKYLGKAPHELSQIELMRGFTVAGVLKGNTVFDASLMDTFVTRYRVSSVYDPCAGWGERLLYCFTRGIAYHGVDVNPALRIGYASMRDAFDIRRQDVVIEDAAAYRPCVRADAVVTCPPYGDTEQYSLFGAETMTVDSFLAWWRKVVENSMFTDARYFAFQVNQKWRDRMLSVVEDMGFYFIEELRYGCVKSNHFTRPDGVNVKREFESMIVCERG